MHEGGHEEVPLSPPTRLCGVEQMAVVLGLSSLLPCARETWARVCPEPLNSCTLQGGTCSYLVTEELVFSKMVCSASGLIKPNPSQVRICHF